MDGLGRSSAEKDLRAVLVGGDHEPAARPGSKESQQHPGLLEQERSQETQVIFPLY